jgi:hypothetical protein
MKLIPYGKNQTLLIIQPGQFEVFFSYQTPVCAEIKYKVYATNKKHSKTTSKHIHDFINGYIDKPIYKDQSFFDQLVK